MPISEKKIVKNSLFLYIRMLFVMLCNFFIVRVLLKALGVEDYGINNVVGGIVLMLAFLSSTMNSASQRFFSFELGKKDLSNLKKYFTSSFWIYVGIVIVVIVLAETLGLWFLCNKMTIPVNRAGAAFWIYQCSIVTFVFSLLSIPYNAAIVAREEMNIYAYVGVLEVLLRLLAAFTLYFADGDLLKTYAVLSCVAMSIPSFFYIIWGTFRFPECRIMVFWNKTMFLEIASFSSWSLFGALSSVFRSQGINILLNIFFNPVVNAARAIAYQVNSALNQFVLNFFKAVQPQIVKTYAAGETNAMFTLVFASTKFNFFLVYLIALPVLLETPRFLSIWLTVLPERTVLFTRLVIVNTIFELMIYPLLTALMATGNIKRYQIVTGSLLLLVLPISYLMLKNGFPPETTLYVTIAITILSQFVRIVFMKKMLYMSVREYVCKAVIPILIVSMLSSIVPIIVELYLNDGFIRFCLVCFFSPISVLLCSFFLGMNKSEKNRLKCLIIQRVGRVRIIKK